MFGDILMISDYDSHYGFKLKYCGKMLRSDDKNYVFAAFLVLGSCKLPGIMVIWCETKVWEMSEKMSIGYWWIL